MCYNACFAISTKKSRRFENDYVSFNSSNMRFVKKNGASRNRFGIVPGLVL